MTYLTDLPGGLGDGLDGLDGLYYLEDYFDVLTDDDLSNRFIFLLSFPSRYCKRKKILKLR